MTAPTPLDDVEFLARSPHRVRVLRTLASGAQTRPDLHDETGVPQPTLGRVLESFVNRHWVEKRGREYALTAFGELVVEEFEALLDTVETVQRLADVFDYLPTESMDFDFRHFADATVTTPETGDAFGHVRRMERLYFEAEHTLFLSNTVGTGSPEERRAQMAEFIDSDRRSESILSVDTIREAITAADSVEMLREGIESGRVKSYVYDGSIPLVLAVADDVVLLAPTDENGIPVALVETENETIRTWAVDLFEAYRAKSMPVTAEQFPL